MMLGQRISFYRKQLGISQEELGARLGVSRQAVSKWETNAAVPDMENLLALARELGVSVAELTETPAEKQTTQASAPRKSFTGSLPLILLIAVVCIALLELTTALYHSFFSDRTTANDAAASEVTVPAPAPKTDFALIWYGSNGDEEFLELGVQEAFFPFGTTLELTEPEEVFDTDFGIMTLHQADCGNIAVGYYHIEEDPELDPESPERESIQSLSTMVQSVHTPRGVHVGSTKAQVLDAYGDDLVYCIKESGSYSLVKHDYYYAFQTQETGGASLQLFMLDGIVAGIQVEHMEDQGSDAFAPNNVSRFPVLNGEPDFSLREDPEQEPLSDARKVYIAFNQLVTNNNLSAEELYAYRRDVFSLLPNVDWREYMVCSGTYEEPDVGFFALMDWLAQQENYSASEILWLQMGCMAPGLDGAYTDMYCHVLSQAFFYDPLTFSKALSTDGIADDTMYHAIEFTAYDADCYPMELAAATQTLTAAIDSGTVFTEPQLGWAKLLLLHLNTSIDQRNDLPKSPSEME